VCGVQKSDELKTQIEQFLAVEHSVSSGINTADETRTQQDIAVTQADA